MKPVCLAALLALVAAPACAHADPRLRSVLYRDGAVERLTSHAGVQASIAFGADEHIENVAIGDSTLWQVTPNKRVNMLFVKPLRARARTNLTVITDQHSYFLDLVAAPGLPAVYLLRFAYPELPKPAPPPAPLTPEEASLAKGQAGAQPVDPATLDFAWVAKGSAALLPTRVYDDGRDTYLAWPEHAHLPAILSEDGKEAGGHTLGPVNFTLRGDNIVVEGVPRRIVLRAGKDSATLTHSPTPPQSPVESHPVSPAP